MKGINRKLQILQDKILNTDEKIKILIFGLGSVGCYLLDYLVSLANPRLEIIVSGRNREKMQMDVNIIRTAATIRRQLRSEIRIEVCDLDNIDSIRKVIESTVPDFIVNSSRVYSGLKYGSISWHNLRAYGIWSPLSVKYAKHIMEAYAKAGSEAITINTSYSDAVIPWIKSSGMSSFDFGSGNLNHLIPRMKFAIAEEFSIKNLNDIDVTLAVSHFHDVVISKEGHSEGQDILLQASYKGNSLPIDKAKILEACKITMPVDQKRNMMNASSNFDIIHSIYIALSEHKKIKIHTPGVNGEIGGYPVIIDGVYRAEACFDSTVFPFEDMRSANRESIYLDGIKDVKDGILYYAPELLAKVKDVFGVVLPSEVPLAQSDSIAERLIKEIIEKQ